MKKLLFTLLLSISAFAFSAEKAKNGKLIMLVEDEAQGMEIAYPEATNESFEEDQKEASEAQEVYLDGEEAFLNELPYIKFDPELFCNGQDAAKLTAQQRFEAELKQAFEKFDRKIYYYIDADIIELTQAIYKKLPLHFDFNKKILFWSPNNEPGCTLIEKVEQYKGMHEAFYKLFHAIHNTMLRNHKLLMEKGRLV